jgi:ectoine hydroxylase-related dioxygenase (phytanoyl-CoA dioxygenase family)
MGCLRVIPGSQRPDHFVRAQQIDPNRSQEFFSVAPRDFPGSIALESNPGDLVIFNHDIYHASFRGGARRRMFTMNLTRNCKTEPDLKTLHQYLRLHSPGGYKVDTGGGMYFPTILDTADETRMIHLQQCADIHDELFPQYARQRS